MDQIGVQFQHQKTSIGDQKKIKPSHQTLKKVTKLLFSLSLFSFFFTNLPFPFHFPHNFHFHFFNQPIDKNSMFLLCNALLVFLANYSGLFKSLSSSPKNFDPNFRLFDFGLDFLHQKPPLIHSETADEKKDDPQENRANLQEEEEKEDEDEEMLVERFFGGETGELEEMIEEEEEGNCGVMSDEELNRKFDEFIKRMKEEIILDDAPRTLVVV
ncbi:unnamed protein product [Citrullus colocynthis]|uniref:Uncharacterized protein n=1 Tax=Citrullus colocynthis TaxID=252529 RepID=A0ABP0XKI1_9ROSI